MDWEAWVERLASGTEPPLREFSDAPPQQQQQQQQQGASTTVAAYLETHKLAATVEKALMEALASQPENPYAALAEWFKTK